nr:thioredoxin domain-containing protein 17-like isoform X1 [Leptinotarsa decemlineata]
MFGVIRRSYSKMVQRHLVEGYEQFCEFFKTFDSQGQLVHVLFSSNSTPDGDTWCTYCKQAWPVIEKELEKADPNSHFVKVVVGDRPYWKDPECPFRKDPKTKLRVLPTMVRWGSPQRLEGEQCDKADLVNMLLNDEED